MSLLAIDCETTGQDFWHGSLPFFVTICDEDQRQRCWEWDVDPLTRRPNVPREQAVEVFQAMTPTSGRREPNPQLVLQNSKFDALALKVAGVVPDFPWHRTHDTLIAGHLLDSGSPHDLTSLVGQYLGLGHAEFGRYEDELGAACQECRKIARAQFPDWRIAREGLAPSMRSGAKGEKDKLWKYDMWLPRRLAQELGEPDDHPWYRVLRDYSNADSAATVALWQAMEPLLRGRGLWELYLDAMNKPRLAMDLEVRGVTGSAARTREQRAGYAAEAEEAGRRCVEIAAEYGHDLEMPKGASPNDSLRELFFGRTRVTCSGCGRERAVKEWAGEDADAASCERCAKKAGEDQWPRQEVEHRPMFDLPRIAGKKSKTAAPTMDKDATTVYLATLEGDRLEFVRELQHKRARDTASAYVAGYERYWLPLRAGGDLFAGGDGADAKDAIDWFRLHPNFNPTGTATLRWSSSHPNGQNVSKKENDCLFCGGDGCRRCGGTGRTSQNLRRCFGPGPGREWWSMDGENLELRIPAYKSGQRELIDLFERRGEPPYWGSQHLLNFSIIYPEIWRAEAEGLTAKLWDGSVVHGDGVGYDRVGPHCKKKCKATYYQWVKNGDFAIQYNCGRATADASFHRDGAYDRLKTVLSDLETLNQSCIAHARRWGWVATFPDVTVSQVGYPLVCGRYEDGGIKSTVPLNYAVQGTAMQWTCRAMYRCDEQIREWRAEDGWDGYMTLQVHDEIVFDCPSGRGAEPWRTNLPRMRQLQRLMELGGEGIGVPTPVSVSYHPDNWGAEISL